MKTAHHFYCICDVKRFMWLLYTSVTFSALLFIGCKQECQWAKSPTFNGLQLYFNRLVHEKEINRKEKDKWTSCSDSQAAFKSFRKKWHLNWSWMKGSSTMTASVVQESWQLWLPMNCLNTRWRLETLLKPESDNDPTIVVLFNYFVSWRRKWLKRDQNCSQKKSPCGHAFLLHHHSK